MRSIHKAIIHGISEKKGSTMIFVMVLISILIFTAGSLMFTVYGSYTMSNIFGQTESIVVDMSMVQSAITRKLEERVNSILQDNVKIYNDNNAKVSDRLIEVIFKVYDNPANNKQNKALFSELGLNREEVKNVLSDWIVSLQGDNPEDISRREDFSKALYDIDFRLHVWVNENNGWIVLDENGNKEKFNENKDTSNGVLYPMDYASPTHTGSTPYDVFDTIGDPNTGMVKPIKSSNPVYASQGLNKFYLKKKTDNNTNGLIIKKHLYGADSNGNDNEDYAWTWLSHMCTTKPQPSNYRFYNLKYNPITNIVVPGNQYTLLNDREKNMKVDYVVKAGNQIGFDKNGNTIELQKTLNLTYMLTSQGFDDNQLLTREVNLPTEFDNDRFQKALVTAEDLFIHGNNGTVTINGNVYAFGHMPGPSYDYDQYNQYSMSQNIVDVLYPDTKNINQWKRNYGGIIIGGTDISQSADNKTVNFNGNVVTRAYMDVRSNNVNVTVNDDLLADTVYIPMRRNEYEPYDPADPDKFVNLTGINVNLLGNVSTYNDLNVGADNSKLQIAGNYIGMNSNSAPRAAQVNATSSVLLNNITSKIIFNGEMVIGGLAYADNIRRTRNDPSDASPYPLKMGLSATAAENHKVYSYNIYDSNVLDTSPSYLSSYFNDDWLIKDIDNASYTPSRYLTYSEAFDNRTNGASQNDLISYFHDYLEMREQDGAKLALNFEPYNTGIIFNKGQRNFAPGILCAQGYQGSYNESDPPPGKFYFLGGASSLGITSFDNVSASPYGVDDFKLRLSPAARAKAEEDLSYIKKYKNTMSDTAYEHGANLNFVDNKTNQLVDADYILGSDNYDPVIADKNDFGDYYCYLTYKPTDLVFGNGSGNVNINTVNNKRGIIYTEGKVIFKPTSDFTFSGVVVALGGIEIDTGNSGCNVTFNYDENAIHGLINLDNSFPESQNLVSQIRRFIAPGNKHKTILDTRDVYRNSSNNIQLVNKKYIKPY